MIGRADRRRDVEPVRTRADRAAGVAPWLVVALCAASATGSTVLRAQEDARARVESGALLGIVRDSVASFKGIPYAAPPVGALRWRAPRAPLSWTEPRPAADYGPSCPQAIAPPRVVPGSAAGETSEDCLTLNIWTPLARRRPLPVMVFIPGGANTQGTGAEVFYIGSRFAHDGVVLVTLNYRLGLLGFFAHPALAKEAGDGPLANYGLLDQIAALQWVQRNIAAFGGDPHDVTVFGESAGALDIALLMTTTEANGLFQRVILQSAGIDRSFPTLARAERGGAVLASALGLPGAAATAAQLRGLPVAQLAAAADSTPGPVIDGRLLRESPVVAFGAGHALVVPMVIGTNGNEGSLLGPTPRLEVLTAGYSAAGIARLRAAYGADAATDTAFARALFRDWRFTAPARWIAAHAQAPVYLYRFNYILSLLRYRRGGADHGSEIPYVFSTWFTARLSPADSAVTATMHRCWVAFASTGVPHCAGAPNWPAYRASADSIEIIGDSSCVAPSPQAAALDAMELELSAPATHGSPSAQ
jgi:para-nitrobenzyl esterase